MEDLVSGKNPVHLPSGLSTLSWKTKVKDILPEFELQDRFATEHATLQDLVTHVTGQARYDDFAHISQSGTYHYNTSRHDYSYSPSDTPKDIVRRLKLLKPAHELREQWSYNSQVRKSHKSVSRLRS